MKWEDMVDENRYKTVQIEELRAKVAHLEGNAEMHMQAYRELEAELKTALDFLDRLINSPDDEPPHSWWCPTTNYNYGDHESECTCWVKDIRAFLEAHHD